MAKRAAPAREQAWSWQLRIDLLGVAPAVWRRIIVRETILLPQLHRVFQTALGWTNSHLHEFFIRGVRYGDLDPGGGISIPNTLIWMPRILRSAKSRLDDEYRVHSLPAQPPPSAL
jgi:hypothetical protein